MPWKGQDDMSGTPTVSIALIPARAGSKRLPLKNIKLLNGIPIIAYSIIAAEKSGLFSEIIVSTDSEEVAVIAENWGAKVPSLRPEEFATDESSDIEWVSHAISKLISSPLESVDKVSILRPTSPLRSSESIVNAMNKLNACPWADSIRAMEVTNKHPGKMWILDEHNRATAFLNQSKEAIPTYNSPTQTLQKLWVQNASLEIAKMSAIIETQTISGRNVLGLELPNFEGLDINTSTDWEFLEYLTVKYPEILPRM